MGATQPGPNKAVRLALERSDRINCVRCGRLFTMRHESDRRQPDVCGDCRDADPEFLDMRERVPSYRRTLTLGGRPR